MKKALSTIFALMLICPLQARQSKFFRLGADFIPSRLKYSDLAEKIESELEGVESVEVFSLEYPSSQRRRSSHYFRDSVYGLNLVFRARVEEMPLPPRQLFSCDLDVTVWPDQTTRLWISDCENPEGFVVEDFAITGMIQFDRSRRGRVFK